MKIKKKDILEFNVDSNGVSTASFFGVLNGEIAGKAIINPFRHSKYGNVDNSLSQERYVFIERVYTVHDKMHDNGRSDPQTVLKYRAMSSDERKKFKLFMKRAKRNCIKSFQFYDW